MSDVWDGKDRQTIEPKENTWKRFLHNKLLALSGLEDKYEYLHIKDLEEFFLGEVARIEKELKPFKGKINFDRDYWIHLNGQLSVYKELAGVEQINE